MLTNHACTQTHNINYNCFLHIIPNFNKDFLKYIQLTAHFYDTKSTSTKEWDIPQHVALDV